MAKIKKAYFCQKCGNQEPKWVGKCNSCGEWNTFVEEILESSTPKQAIRNPSQGKKNLVKPKLLKEIENRNDKRAITPDKEFNRVLGGGIVYGSLVLIGGEPGIGKSTLMLQLALNLPLLKVLYISGEESQTQIKMRAERLGLNAPNCYIYTETDTSQIFNQINEIEPDLVIVDSIQTIYSPQVETAQGSVSQIRQCAGEFMRFAKEQSVPVFLIGHITKDGSIAGPKILEHLVDTVLQFEGDRNYNYRILRAVKNRFGSTSELGIYEMQGIGLREVNNPSEILISQRNEATPGIAIGTSLEGNRPLLIETQALVSNAAYGNPQRSSTGFDNKRLNMLLAILEKRGGYRLGAQDVFLNIAGGLKVEDPAIDLALAVAIVSSFEDIPVPDNCCFAAELGLGGEIRAVNRIESRIAEAEKLGFQKIILSEYNLKNLENKNRKIEIKAFTKMIDVMDNFF